MFFIHRDSFRMDINISQGVLVGGGKEVKAIRQGAGLLIAT